MRLAPKEPCVRVIRHAHLFCGLGGGAKGFNRARPRVGNTTARFVCVGGNQQAFEMERGEALNHG